MKLLSLFLITLFLSVNLFAQVTTSYNEPGSNQLELVFSASAIDSGQNASTSFKNITADWLDWTADLTTYDVGYEYALDTLTAPGEIMGIYIEGMTNIGTWNKVDTLFTADTLGQGTGAPNLTGFGLTDFNQSAVGSFPEYRINFDASASDSTGNTFDADLTLYFRKRN